MCGFVVLARSGGLRREEAAPTFITRLRDTMLHRGPDAGTSQLIDDWVALGHRRLSIIDLVGSPQPLASERGDVHCVFNGEIYNFRELRARLVSLGHRFATNGDGEVLVHGYEEWGEDLLRRVEGMFAFAIVDRARRRVLVARDRVGIKPVHFAVAGGLFVAASEVAAVIEHPAIPRQANALALAIGASRMHIPWPLSAFADVSKLGPGTAIWFYGNGASPATFRYHRWAPGKPSTEAEVNATLDSVVRKQLVADVPIGAFLSSGVDSTLMTALMKREMAEPLHTFTIGASGEDDESGIALRTAERIGTIHHVESMVEAVPSELTSIAEMVGEPFAETSILGVRRLAQLAKSQVKVAVSGDGGDEVFGGYPIYRWLAAASLLRQRIGFGAGALEFAAGRLQRLPGDLPRRLARAGRLVVAPEDQAYQDLAYPARLESAVPADLELSRRVRAACVENWPRSALRRAMLADRIERLPNAMLAKVDAASMAESLEVRVPLLDERLMDVGDGLPDGALTAARWGKRILRKRLDEELPHGPAWDRKRGFALPLESWLKQRNAQAFRSLLVEARAPLRELLGVDAVASWERFLGPDRSISKGTQAMQLLWLASVAVWTKRFAVSTVRLSEMPAVV